MMKKVNFVFLISICFPIFAAHDGAIHNIALWIALVSNAQPVVTAHHERLHNERQHDAEVAHAQRSGAKPSTCSASRFKNDSGINKGNAAF